MALPLETVKLLETFNSMYEKYGPEDPVVREILDVSGGMAKLYDRYIEPVLPDCRYADYLIDANGYLKEIFKLVEPFIFDCLEEPTKNELIEALEETQCWGQLQQLVHQSKFTPTKDNISNYLKIFDDPSTRERDRFYSITSFMETLVKRGLYTTEIADEHPNERDQLFLSIVDMVWHKATHADLIINMVRKGLHHKGEITQLFVAKSEFRKCKRLFKAIVSKGHKFQKNELARIMEDYAIPKCDCSYIRRIIEAGYKPTSDDITAAIRQIADWRKCVAVIDALAENRRGIVSNSHLDWVAKYRFEGLGPAEVSNHLISKYKCDPNHESAPILVTFDSRDCIFTEDPVRIGRKRISKIGWAEKLNQPEYKKAKFKRVPHSRGLRKEPTHG